MAAGCGADAAPYFRIFNPITQGEKFDARVLTLRDGFPHLKTCHPSGCFAHGKLLRLCWKKVKLAWVKTIPFPALTMVKEEPVHSLHLHHSRHDHYLRPCLFCLLARITVSV